MGEPERKSICSNRRARHDYAIEETVEAGIALTGPEVKSLRLGGAQLKDSYARIQRGEVFLVKAHIAPYVQANRWNLDPERERKLLLHRREIDRLEGRVRERGLTLIPLELYWKDGRAKVALALARGKKSYDKRADIARREADVRIRRARGRQAKRG
jgi:SsrA-binding protein